MTTRLLSVLGLAALFSSGAWAATLTVDTTDPAPVQDGWCSLVEAIDNANADTQVHIDCPAGSGADVIELGTMQTYTLVESYGGSATGLPEIESGITINGHGSTIQRDPSPTTPRFRLLYVYAAGNLALNDLTLSNGSATGHGGGIFNLGTLALDHCTVANNNANACAGVHNFGGTAELTDSQVELNTSQIHGGGLCNQTSSTDATMTVTRSGINANVALGTTQSVGGGGIVTATGADRTALLVLSQSWVTNNEAPSAAGIGQNFNTTFTNARSTLIIDRCVISYNINTPGVNLAAGVLSIGGADMVTVTEIRRTEITENRGDLGGVEAWRNVDLTITDSTIDKNDAQDAGGGILVGARTRLHLERSTVCHNTADGGDERWAGGVAVVDGTATIINSTISNNWSGANGGGVGAVSALQWGGTGATVDISNSTITANNTGDVDAGGGINAFRESGDGVVEVFLRNTIVAANYNQGGTVLGNCTIAATASLDSLGFNLADDGTCQLTQPNDLVVADAMLGPLGGHTGPLPCHVPLPGSPAIDSGDDLNCPAADQLGQVRPWDGDFDGFAQCDRGAIETWAPFFIDGFESGDTSAWTATMP